MNLDAHQHFWIYNPRQHTWMTDDMQVLRRNYLPQDLHPLLSENGFDGSIAVQARQIPEETEWLLQLAANNPSIKGVVGWVNLQSEQLRDQLQQFSANPKLVGVRHVIHDEADDTFMLRRNFLRGIETLQEYGLAYDLLLFPKHLIPAVDLVQNFPSQTFILDHIAKPDIKNHRLEPWRTYINRLAESENVFCKLSGMVTEATWGKWEPSDFVPYLDAVMEAFGPNRVMIGSDWPVCTLSASYTEAIHIVRQYITHLAPPAQDAILGGNCARAYHL